MATGFNDPVFIRLAEVLESERGLLQSGRAGEAAGLIEEKMAALQAFEAALQRAPPPGASLQRRGAVERIIRMAQENAAHMEAIRNGIRHAINRLESINSSAHVGSYGRGGAQLSFTNAIGAYNRKG